MAKKKTGSVADNGLTLWDFAATIEQAEVLSKEQVTGTTDTGEDYSPVDETANYMHRAVRFEEVWETTIAEAREKLLQEDAAQLYLEFFNDLVNQINKKVPKAAKLLTMLEQ